VTISDAELEAALRNLRIRADGIAPPPFDLPERVRDRHRSLRRREFGLAAAALSAVLVLVGVPVVASTITAGDRGGIAAPSEGSEPAPVPTLAELGTRGSLAGDAAWVEAVTGLSWASTAPGTDQPSGAAVAEPPVKSRVVAFAGDVPGARVALVLGLDSPPVDAWFIGPVGATPDQMVLASAPRETTARHPLALMDGPLSGSDGPTFVVVAWPGDEVTQLTGRHVNAAGKTTEHRETVLLTDGAGSIASPVPATWPLEVQLWVERNSGVPGSYNPQMTITDRALGANGRAVDVADPRGLRGSVRDQDVQSAVAALTGYYGMPAEEIRPTLLAGGPLGDGSPSSSVLVGVTFPSGATTAAQVTIWAIDGIPGLSSQVGLTDVAPAGTALLDRVFAVPSSVPGSLMLTVSGPTSAVRAVVHGRDGTLMVNVPLTRGAGSAAVTGDLDGATVRLFDGRGALLATAPITGPVGG
jgi:hypothetical protein